VFYNGKITLIKKLLSVLNHCPVQFPNENLRKIHLTGEENVLRPFVGNHHYLPQLSATQYLRWRDRLNGIV
jgi:hypothetical protein